MTASALAIVPERSAPRHRWKCSRCGRACDEAVLFDWGRTWAPCSCGVGVDVEVRRDLAGRVLSVRGVGAGGPRC